MNKRDQILEALSAFIRQRPGLEYGNYGNPVSYRAEMRSITQDRHHAETLLAAVRWRESIGEPQLREAFRAFSGRLSIVDRADGAIGLDYCTGQYFPTEYRKAVCAVLSAALWDHLRDNNLLPTTTGDSMRATFRREFGRTIANRYFN